MAWIRHGMASVLLLATILFATHGMSWTAVRVVALWMALPAGLVLLVILGAWIKR